MGRTLEEVLKSLPIEEQILIENRYRELLRQIEEQRKLADQFREEARSLEHRLFLR